MNFLQDHSSEIVSLYREHVPVYLEALQSAVASKNSEQIVSSSHKMNSAMKTVGFIEVANLLELVESEQHSEKELAELIARITTLVTDSLLELDSQ